MGALLYTAMAVAYSIYGAYVQLGLIRAVCIYCVTSRVITVLLLLAALRHLGRRPIPLAVGDAFAGVTS